LIEWASATLSALPAIDAVILSLIRKADLSDQSNGAKLLAVRFPTVLSDEANSLDCRLGPERVPKLRRPCTTPSRRLNIAISRGPIGLVMTQ
jgi:hypothetical protein